MNPTVLAFVLFALGGAWATAAVALAGGRLEALMTALSFLAVGGVLVAVS